MKPACLIVLVFGFACPLARSAQAGAPPATQPPGSRDFSHMQVIELANGPNVIDINGDGHKDLVFNAHRSNFNAHDFEHITFYMQASVAAGGADATTSEKPLWHVVPFFTAQAPEFVAFDTVEGADCWLRDMVLLRNPEGSITAVVANRDMGSSYADKARVTFSIYRVAHNANGQAGAPPIYFQRVDRFPGKSLYCDVDHAMVAELGVKLLPRPEDNGIDH
jgi:hypothetical protein